MRTNKSEPYVNLIFLCMPHWYIASVAKWFTCLYCAGGAGFESREKIRFSETAKEYLRHYFKLSNVISKVIRIAEAKTR